MDAAIQSALGGQPIVASADQEGSPTYLEDLVRAIERLILEEARGIVHVVNDGAATAAQIASTIVELVGSTSEVIAVPAAEIPGAIPNRSLTEVLRSCRIQLRPWHDALKEYAHLQMSRSIGCSAAISE